MSLGVYAVIPAAGVSSRMGNLCADGSKIFLPLADGSSVLAQTIRSLLIAVQCDGIVISVRDNELSTVESLLEPLRVKWEPQGTWLKAVSGGATRQESVMRAIDAVPEDAELIIIHDGARPLCPVECIQAVVQKGREVGSAILAVPIKPTLKRVVQGEETIAATVPRSEIWGAQTPQVFHYDIIVAAIEKANADGFVGTDDSQLVEHLGKSVAVVPGSDHNIKITTPEDLAIAQGIFALGNDRER